MMTLNAVLCCAVRGRQLGNAAEWASDNEDGLKKYLVLERGTPSHSTFGRVFRLRDAEAFKQCFCRWIWGIAGNVKGVLHSPERA